MNNDFLFKAMDISKNFGPVKALDQIDLVLNNGEVLGLIGENGSGKSTLSAIIAGIHKSSSGKMYLNKNSYKPSSTIDGMNHGVSMIVQEQGTIAGITVAANIFLGKEDLFSSFKGLQVKKMQKKAQEALDSIGADHIDASSQINNLSFEDKKLVEVARAMRQKPQILIIDETTTALTLKGRKILYDLIKRHSDEGMSVLFISHDLEEIMEICNALVVLRDGCKVGRLDKKQFGAEKIKQLMIGREMSGHFYRENDESSIAAEVVLEGKSISHGLLKNVSLKLHEGEILGVGGLSDCGMHELGKVLYGLIKPQTGKVIWLNKSVITHAKQAVDLGLAYVSKDRDEESLMQVCSIKDNICLPSLKELGKHGFIWKKKEIALAAKWAKRLNVKMKSINQYCNTLSGGNKQKVVIAKWMGKDSQILILDCPTRGIDIGAKAAIYQLIEKLKMQGKSIILISEEMQELIGMSDRILILKKGLLAGEFNRSDGFTESKLIDRMI